MAEINLLNTICSSCPRGVEGKCDTAADKCGGCPLYPMRSGDDRIPACPPYRFGDSDWTWDPCRECPGAIVTDVPDKPGYVDITLRDLYHCLDCPAKILRDAIDEACAEARMS